MRIHEFSRQTRKSARRERLEQHSPGRGRVQKAQHGLQRAHAEQLQEHHQRKFRRAKRDHDHDSLKARFANADFAHEQERRQQHDRVITDGNVGGRFVIDFELRRDDVRRGSEG